MLELLDNPVYYSLTHSDSHLGFGQGKVRYFDEEVSPFAGFETGYENGFRELYDLLPAGRKILFATRNTIQEPNGWKLTHLIQGSQFVFTGPLPEDPVLHELVPLEQKHVAEMVALAALTKPGPFNTRTIEFGNYFGVFQNGKLAAMTGQRMHVDNYSEVSAVCTHPDHSGKGYAYALMLHQVRLILQDQQIPFLHVRTDNTRAIEIYKRTGFILNGAMNFYVLQR